MEESLFMDPFQTDAFDFSSDRFEFPSIHSYQENLNFINPTKLVQNPQISSFSNCYHIQESCDIPIHKRSSQIISFGCSNSSPENESLKLSSVIDVDRYGGLPDQGGRTKRKAGSVTRNGFLAQEHVLAERKRREILNERFIALSALLPGLKKVDKASVLGDAVKHLKELQERVRTLEEQQETNKNMESVIIVKNSRLSIDDDRSSSSISTSFSSSEENFNGTTWLSHHPLPEIEARVSRNEVLIKIHCEKNKGRMADILGEIEKLGLTVINSIVLPFGNSILDISVRAKMEDFSMPVKDLVKNLRLAVLQYS